MPFIQQQNEEREDYKVRIKKSKVVVVLKSKPSTGILLLALFSIVVPVLVYYFVIDRGAYQEPETDTCSLDKTYRIRCGNPNATYNYCHSINCCFDNVTKTCFHYLPSKYQYFRKSENEQYERKLQKSPFGKTISPHVTLVVNEIDESTLQIIISDANVTTPTNVTTKKYSYNINQEPLFIEVYRDDFLLLTTAKGPLILSENYWEWSFQLTTEYLFGLGQTLIDLDENSTFTKAIYANRDDHNTLPFFLANQNGSFHGLIVRHSGPLELTVLPSKVVSLKVLSGGIGMVTLELSVGPTLKEVIAQQKQRKTVQDFDFDLLGTHICREGELQTLTEILDEYGNFNQTIEYDSDCLHENLITALRRESKQEIFDKVLETVKSLKRFVLSVPPQVFTSSELHNNTKGLNVFFQNKTDDFEGQYLGNNVVYPYFNHPNISQFLEYLIDETKSYFGDIWSDDFIIFLNHNWPKEDSFQMGSDPSFQYLSQELIDAMSFTIPWDITAEKRYQFLDHNSYGPSQIREISNILPNKIMSASHSFDQTHPVLLQNVDISWFNFRKTIISTLFNSISGFPFTSVPICGSTNIFNSSYESLCLRWYLMAATAPVFRISSDLPRRDPDSLSPYLADKAKWAINFRYSLQYYFYDTLSSGEPLMRPVFYDFPDDNNTFGLVEQYMVGPGLMVAQPTLPNQNQIKIYLPPKVTWFEFWGGDTYNGSIKDGWLTLSVVESDWIGFVKEGVVIPIVEKDVEDKQRVTLKIALQCDNDSCSSSGVLRTPTALFSFISTDKELNISVNQPNDETFVLSTVEILKNTMEMVTLVLAEEKSLHDITKCTFDINSIIC